MQTTLDRKTGDPNGILLTQKQVADRWQTCEETVKRRRQAGSLKWLCLGRAVRFRLADILKFEEERIVE